MAVSIFLWLSLAIQAEYREAFMPENTALVVSLNPGALAETPAFLSLCGRLSSQWREFEESLAKVEKVASLEDIEEITFIVPLDAQLRRNERILLRGHFDLSYLVHLARSRGLSPAEIFDNGSFMLSTGKAGDLALGVLPDGSVLLAEPKTLKKDLKSFHNREKNQFAPTFTSALEDVEIGAAMWGAAGIPDNLALLSGISSDLPLDRIEGLHFYVDVNLDFKVHLFLKARAGMDPRDLADELREMMGMPPIESKGDRKKKRKRSPEAVSAKTLAMLKDLSIEPGDGEVKVCFTLMTDDLYEVVAGLSDKAMNIRK